MILKAADKIEIQSLSQEASKYASTCSQVGTTPGDAAVGYFEGFKKCVEYIEKRKLEGVGFQQLMWELKVITES